MGRASRGGTLKIGTMVLIGDTKHVIIDKFWVGFEMLDDDLRKEHYYETFSMGNDDGKRRTAIARADFEAGLEEGKIRVISPA